MLLELAPLLQKYSLDIKGAIHVGAHWGEEYSVYKECGISGMIFFEPTRSSFQELSKRLAIKDVILVNKAVGNLNQSIEMYVETANKGQSSSVLEPTRHLTDYPNIVFEEKEIVEMVRLDDFIKKPSQYNLLNLDVQGYELEVLKGSENMLSQIDAIITEVNFDQLYKNGVLIEELDDFLKLHSFVRVETKWWKKSCWGDALYVSERVL